MSQQAAVVFAGGVGLGAYQGGAYEALSKSGHFNADWLGSSVGAINAALIAGNPPARRVSALREFWSASNFPASFEIGPSLHIQSWMTVLSTRLFGAAGYFTPRLRLNPFDRFQSFYDLEPTRRRVEQLLDFDLLNRGDVRVSIATTDLESGELVTFDTAAGDKLKADHLLASCGFLPEFAPVEIGSRLLGDGGLYANAPVEIVLTEDAERTVFVIDLFASDGSRPTGLESSLERKNDLFFGNQTRRVLDAYCRQKQDRRTIFYLSHRASKHDAGPEKTFNYSRHSLRDRWAAGYLDMEAALQQATSSDAAAGLHIVRRGKHPHEKTAVVN